MMYGLSYNPDLLAASDETSHCLFAKKHSALGLSPLTRFPRRSTHCLRRKFLVSQPISEHGVSSANSASSLLGPHRLAGAEETSHGLFAKKHSALGLSPITTHKK